MSDHDPLARMMKDTEGLSADELVRVLDGGRPMRSSDYVSIDDLAAESGRSVRTLRRWMYRRVDVQHWAGRSERSTPS